MVRSTAIAAFAVASFASSGMSAAQADPFLDEIVEFTGEILFIDTKVPAVVIGAVRNGEVSVRGFGERAGPGSPPHRLTATHCCALAPSPKYSRGRCLPISPPKTKCSSQNL